MRLLRYAVLINTTKRNYITTKLKKLTPCTELAQGVKIEKEFKYYFFLFSERIKEGRPKN